MRALRALYDADLLRGAAHITGGGLVDNPPRMLPDGAHAAAAHPAPAAGRCRPSSSCSRAAATSTDGEMLRTFNMGIGMLVCVPGDRVAEATDAARARRRERCFRVGEVVAADAPEAPVEFVAREARRMNVGVLVSGSGTNLQALIDRGRRGELGPAG